MTWKNIACLTAVSALFGVSSTLTPDTNQPELSPKVKALMVERRDTLRELVRYHESKLAGLSTSQSLVDICQSLSASSYELLQAELPLAQTDAKRKDLVSEFVEQTKGWEEKVIQRIDAGSDAILEVRSLRLKAEIQLAELDN